MAIYLNLCLVDTQEVTAVAYPDQEVDHVADHHVPEVIAVHIRVVDLVRLMIDAIDVWAITIGHDSLTIVSVDVHFTMGSLSI